MSVPYDVSGHALERLEERFPHEYPDNDLSAAWMIQREIEDALASGRVGRAIPPEFLQDVTTSFQHEFAWTRDGRRGYVIRDTGRRVTVITTLARHHAPHRLVKPVGQGGDQRRPTVGGSSAHTAERDA